MRIKVWHVLALVLLVIFVIGLVITGAFDGFGSSVKNASNSLLGAFGVQPTSDTPIASDNEPSIVPSSNDPVGGTSSRPTAWIPDNEKDGKPICSYGIPDGTVLNRDGNPKLTNCVSFNQEAGSTVPVDWGYSQEDYDFLLDKWDGTEHKWSGVAWWAQVLDPNISYAEVSYNGSPVQKCTSFQIYPDVPMHVVFYNGGTTPSIWSQGAIVSWEPVCQYNGGGIPVLQATPTLASTQVPSQPTATPSTQSFPSPDSQMVSTKDATYGPFRFTAESNFQIQYLNPEGNAYVFHLVGWGVETFGNCTWYNWSNGLLAGEPWTGDYKVVCTQ